MSKLTTYRISEVHHILAPAIGSLRLEAQNGKVKASTVDDLYQRFLRLETEATDTQLQAIADAWNNDELGRGFAKGAVINFNPELAALLDALEETT